MEQPLNSSKISASFENSNYFVRYSYTFVNNFINYANAKTITQDQLPVTESDDEAYKNSSNLLNEWEKEENLTKCLVFLF